MSILEIHPDNSVTVQITLSNPILEAFVNDAAVTSLIKDDDGVIIETEFPLPYIAASDGIYRTTLPPIDGLILDEIYTVVINADGADSLKGYWEARIRACLASIS